MIETIQSQERKKRFGDELYGVYALLEARDEAEWQLALSMIGEQEAHHIAEGLSLTQRDIRDFIFRDGSVVDPYTGRPMVETCQNAIDAVDETADPDLYTQFQNDKRVEKAANSLMRVGEIGDGFWRVLPYAQEQTDRQARARGMWPERRRSYLHLYRKADHDQLEVTAITMDESDLEAYKGLLGDAGVTVSSSAQSHDLTGMMAHVSGLLNVADRDACLDGLRASYATHHPAGHIQGDPDAEAFLERHRAEIAELPQLYEALSESLKKGRLSSEAIKALKDTYALAMELNLPEQFSLIDLARSSGRGQVTLQEHGHALRFLINVRRYGIWQYLRQELDDAGSRQSLVTGSFEGYARLAAWAQEVMPGCPGGFGLEAMFSSIWGESSWHGGVVTSGICEGCNRSTKVGAAGWCRSCISGHCGT